MEKEEIKKIALANGLELHLYDASKRLVGNRWNVCLVAEIPVDVSQFLASTTIDSKTLREGIKALLGDRICFKQKRQKHFVDTQDKDTVFAELQSSLLETTLCYLSHEEFAKNFIMREYQSACREKKMKRDIERFTN
jgi:hypothetical protein